MENPEKLELTNQLLEEIEYGMNNHNEELRWYLDVQKGETLFASDMDITGEAGFVDEEDLDPERYYYIPTLSSRDGWKQMEDFILDLQGLDKRTIDLLLRSLEGRGAFFRFKNSIARLGLLDHWYEYKGREDRKAVLDWLYSEELIQEEDVEKGMRLYVEVLAVRKKRKEDEENMVTGRHVKVSDDRDHQGKLTIGKFYRIVDVKSEHPMIRLEDDRGKLCWFPKSHFELEEH